MKTVEDLTELNKIKLNQLFKYINNYIFQAIRSKKHFYCFDNKKNIGCNLYKIGRRCSLVAITSGLQPENRVSITLRSTIFCRLGFYTERVL